MSDKPDNQPETIDLVVDDVVTTQSATKPDNQPETIDLVVDDVVTTQSATTEQKEESDGSVQDGS